MLGNALEKDVNMSRPSLAGVPTPLRNDKGHRDIPTQLIARARIMMSLVSILENNFSKSMGVQILLKPPLSDSGIFFKSPFKGKFFMTGSDDSRTPELREREDGVQE